MTLNPNKCHFLPLDFSKPFSDISFENIIIKNVAEEKILRIVIDKNLFNFKSHMKKMCEKFNQKFSTLARILKLTTPTQLTILINYFISAQYTHCTFTQMFS